MAYTLTTATTAVRNVLNEATANFWSDTQIQSWIKDGCVDLSGKGMVYLNNESITLAATTLYYTSTEEAWIANAARIFSAYYDDGSNGYNGVLKIDPSQIGHMPQATAGAPEYFALSGKRVYVWPLTSATIVSAGGTLNFEVAEITDDIANLEFEYQHLVINYAIAYALARDKHFQDANMFFSVYRTGLEFERKDKVERERGSYAEFKTR